MILHNIRLNLAAVESVELGDDVQIRFKSGRVLCWPHSRRKVLTVHGQSIVRDCQLQAGEIEAGTSQAMLPSEIRMKDGSLLAGYEVCPHCKTELVKVGVRCRCQQKQDEARHAAEAVKPN